MTKFMQTALAVTLSVLAVLPATAQDEEGLLRSTFGYDITRNVAPSGATEAQKALIADVALLNEAARGSTDPQGEGLRFAAMAEYARWLLSTQGICSHEEGDSLVWGGECTDEQKVSPLAGYEF